MSAWIARFDDAPGSLALSLTAIPPWCWSVPDCDTWLVPSGVTRSTWAWSTWKLSLIKPRRADVLSLSLSADIFAHNYWQYPYSHGSMLFSLMERQACNQVFFALARMLSPSYARSMRSAWLQLRAGVKSKHSVLTVSLDANRWILLNGIAKRRYDWREEDLKISPVL